jgi:hypothetical protein
MILVELKGRLYMYSGVACAVVPSREGLMGHARRHGQHVHFSNMPHEKILRLREGPEEPSGLYLSLRVDNRAGRHTKHHGDPSPKGDAS